MSLDTQSPLDDLYKKCPMLQDIANRLDDSEKETAKFNAENKVKKRRKKPGETTENTVTETKSSYGIKYPEYCRITQIYRNGGWEDMANLPKQGKENFTRSLISTVDTRNPKGLNIEIYSGKSASSKTGAFTCWLADINDDEVKKEMANSTANKSIGFADDLSEIKKELEKFKTSNPTQAFNPETMQLMFDMKLLKLEHKQELEKAANLFQTQLDKKDVEIENLESEISDLNEQLVEQDEELLGTAELIEAKKQPQPITVMLTEIFQNGLVGLAFRNQHILKDWGLSQEAIKLMWENQQKLIGAAPKTITENSEETQNFTEAKSEYSHQSPEHAEHAKTITAFVNQLTFEHFKLIYTILFFCSNEGELNLDHVNKLIPYIYEITKNEEPVKTE